VRATTSATIAARRPRFSATAKCSLAGNVSGGLEPIFAASYSRKVLGTDGEPIEFALTDYALQQWRQMTGRTTGMPDHFVAAANLPVRAHLYTQAAIYTGSAAAFSRQLDLKDHQRA
jgi:ribonucleoside-diphosphate reductase alpha chain